jgi:hypothetical protein
MKLRATRFSIQLRLRYRAVGDTTWGTGESTNISRTGLLFRGDRVVMPRTEVELSFRLPIAIPGRPPADVTCQCEIVRHAASAPGDAMEIGATISAYQFGRMAAES